MHVVGRIGFFDIGFAEGDVLCRDFIGVTHLNRALVFGCFGSHDVGQFRNDLSMCPGIPLMFQPEVPLDYDWGRF